MTGTEYYLLAAVVEQLISAVAAVLIGNSDDHCVIHSDLFVNVTEGNRCEAFLPE